MTSCDGWSQFETILQKIYGLIERWWGFASIIVRGLLGFDDVTCFPRFYNNDNIEYEAPIPLHLNPSIMILDLQPISLHCIEPQ